MAITSYPRVTIQGSGAAQNPQNGTGLMILNPSTQKYEAATAATFSGGGGGGGATAANQTSQINEAQTLNALIIALNSLITTLNSYNNAFGSSTAEYLFEISENTNNANNTLNNIYNALDSGGASVLLVDINGDPIGVTSGRLNVNTGA